MLAKYRVGATLPASDMERAKRFYTEKLGLEPTQEMGGGVAFECAEGTGIFVFPSPNAGKCPTTYAGWEVDDVEAVVAELKGKGVVFEEYDTPEYKTVDGIATIGPGKAAWFKDSEGNILALSEMQ
jgi:catechol 2,3-dioxygenase-like lactoylglutathione lyase family enzyme